ncbi:MAG: GNAT family N-acetyltransferase [Planctomycetota bacterium]
MNFELCLCHHPEEYENAKAITRAYMEWLNMDLCFQNVDHEMNSFSQMYGEPQGAYILAKVGNAPAGGLGIRLLEKDICEMKRLYVYQRFQGLGIGKALCLKSLEIAKILGYKTMRLDTVPRLIAANHLYEALGFVDIPKYRDNPEPCARFMQKSLI